jgi:saccharopine dehydrogenase (NAD+, L-lysine-forming)
MRVGLIKERKIPTDTRVALTPDQCKALVSTFSNLEIVVESSSERCYADNEYVNAGFEVITDMTNCDLLLGIKEVPKDALIAGKTYLFFSHTIKQQQHNRALFQTALKKNITLIDYECLQWPNGGRILGFGNWAGIVGTYNALLVWGKKMGEFSLKPAWQCLDYSEVKQELKKVKSAKLTIALTGDGRVANGSIEVLNLIGAKEISPEAIHNEYFNGVSFVHLNNSRLYKRKDGGAFESRHFYTHHQEYYCCFNEYIPYVDLLINGMYWENDMGILFTTEDTQRSDFAINVIADITCDIEGSVPITVKDTRIADPVFGWDRKAGLVVAPYGKDTIDIMAVSNLPAELPRNASEAFGAMLSQDVLPLLLAGQTNNIIEKATLMANGKVLPQFDYLTEYGASENVFSK